MKQKGGTLDKLISAAGTAMVPFALYQANKLYAKRSRTNSTKRQANKSKMNRLKSTMRKKRRSRRKNQLKSIKSLYKSRSRSRSRRRRNRTRK